MVKCLTCQHRRLEFDPWVGKIPWRREWLTHSSILAWEIPWAESLEDYSPWGQQRVGHN